MFTTVTQDYTAVSGTTGTHIDGFVLHVRRMYRTTPEIAQRIAERNSRVIHYGEGRIGVRADHDGQAFPTREEGWAFALEHGYLQVFRSGGDLRLRRQLRGDEIREQVMAYKAGRR